MKGVSDLKGIFVENNESPIIIMYIKNRARLQLYAENFILNFKKGLKLVETITIMLAVPIPHLETGYASFSAASAHIPYFGFYST